MSITGELAIFIFVVIVCVLVGFMLGVFLGDTYRNGKIDCLNNKIYYQLETQDDGSSRWVYVSDGVAER